MAIPVIRDGEGLRLDAAARALATGSIDAPARADLEAVSGTISRAVQSDRLDGAGLDAAILDYIMPRIGNPAVLRLERRRHLLERFEARAAARSAGEPLVPGGIVALRHELQNMALLRGNRDGLIEG